MKSLQTESSAVSEFYKLVMQGVEAWLKAGEIVAKEMDKDPAFVDNVIRKHPELSEDFILAFDRIGRKALHPKLLMDDRAGIVALRSMNYETQEKFLSEPVPTLVKTEDGWQTLNIETRNLTPVQARQVFDTKQRTVRTPAAQRAWIESKRTMESVSSDEPYRIVGATLVVMTPTKFSRKQLAQFLANME